MTQGATISISPDLIGHVRRLYMMTLADFASGKFSRSGINGHSSYAFPAYVLSVAAVEAYINEVFIAAPGRWVTRGRPLWKLPKDWIEKLDLPKKLVLVPQLLFGASFDPHAQPYQGMSLLIKLRNEIVHYKMSVTPPKLLRDLDQRGISLVAPGVAEHGGTILGQADYSLPKG